MFHFHLGPQWSVQAEEKCCAPLCHRVNLRFDVCGQAQTSSTLFSHDWWGLCVLRHGIQNLMEAIYAHPPPPPPPTLLYPKNDWTGWWFPVICDALTQTPFKLFLWSPCALHHSLRFKFSKANCWKRNRDCEWIFLSEPIERRKVQLLSTNNQIFVSFAGRWFVLDSWNFLWCSFLSRDVWVWVGTFQLS